MNKAGYIISLIGGVLAIFFSVLLIITGPLLFAGKDAYDFVTDNEQELDEIWAYIGDYNGIDEFLTNDFEDYVDEYAQVLEEIDADELEDMGKQYDVKAFAKLADIYTDFEEYLPNLKLGVLICLIASVAALIGAELARRFHIAGGVMVLSGAALTLIFSLVAGSIIPMAAASLLLILGGIMQILKPKQKAASLPVKQNSGGEVLS